MAKFKVGDMVSVKREAAEMIDNPALARKRGRVTKVLPGGYYEVDGELGATGLELTDAELTLANSRACNAKFKRGDSAYIRKTGEFCKIVSEMPKQAGRSVYKVKILEGFGRGEEEGLFEDDLMSEGEHLRSLGTNANTPCNAVRSTNAVVQKALNACGTARNATVDVRKTEADTNAWIAAIKDAAQAKRKAEEIGRRLYETFFDWETVAESPELQKLKKRLEAVYSDASYLNRSSTGFFTSP